MNMENEQIVTEETTVVETKQESKPKATPKEDNAKEPTAQDLMVELARYKRSIDKLTHENAELTKKYRSTLSEQEQLSLEKAEAEALKDERLKELERKDRIHDLTENFMDLGYDKAQAKKAAAAQVDGDTQTLFEVQSQVQASLLKAKEAEWLKSIPQVNAGVGGKEEVDPFLQGFASVPTRFSR